MRPIYDEQVLRTIIEAVSGPLTAEQNQRLINALVRHDDPKRGYIIIGTPESALVWLTGNYEVASFHDGMGLMNKRSGGCWGYFAGGLLEQMQRDGLLDDKYRITLAGKIAALTNKIS